MEGLSSTCGRALSLQGGRNNSIASACVDKVGGREQVSYTKPKQPETDNCY